MSYEPEQLREWAEFVTWDEPDYRKPSVKEISAQLDAHADVLEERQELIAALREIGASDEEIMGSKYNRKVDELALAMCAAIAGVKP